MPIAAHFDKAVSQEGQSRAARRRLRLETQGALASGAPAEVLVHNISETGLLLETPHELEIGETIEIDLPEAKAVRAQVVWASAQLYGCAFASPLSSATLSAAQLRSAVQNAGVVTEPPVPAGPAAIGGASLGEKLHHLRKLRGLTQGELAVRLGVSKPTVWAWEQNRARPIEERIEAIAEALGVSAAELRPSRNVPGLSELIVRCRHEIANVVETSPDKVKIMIEL